MRTALIGFWNRSSSCTMRDPWMCTENPAAAVESSAPLSSSKASLVTIRMRSGISLLWSDEQWRLFIRDWNERRTFRLLPGMGKFLK